MTRFHNGFNEGGSAREKLKHINKWIARLKDEDYKPHPFEIVGIDKYEPTLPSVPSPSSSTPDGDW
jgi:hypothetical protein